jgi:hypothetical protein
MNLYLTYHWKTVKNIFRFNKIVSIKKKIERASNHSNLNQCQQNQIILVCNGTWHAHVHATNNNQHSILSICYHSLQQRYIVLCLIYSHNKIFSNQFENEFHLNNTRKKLSSSVKPKKVELCKQQDFFPSNSRKLIWHRKPEQVITASVN